MKEVSQPIIVQLQSGQTHTLLWQTQHAKLLHVRLIQERVDLEQVRIHTRPGLKVIVVAELVPALIGPADGGYGEQTLRIEK